MQRHTIAAGIAHHALGSARSAGGIEDIKGIGSLDRHARRRFGRRLEGCPVVIPCAEFSFMPLALQHHTGGRLVRAARQRLIDDGL